MNTVKRLSPNLINSKKDYAKPLVWIEADHYATGMCSHILQEGGVGDRRLEKHRFDFGLKIAKQHVF